MFLLLLILSYSHLYAVVTDGASFPKLKMLAVNHEPDPDDANHQLYQERVKRQLVILNEFAETQSQQNTVVLYEEPPPLIVAPDQHCIFSGVREVADKNGMNSKTIDLRGATKAAAHTLQRFLKGKPVDATLAFGPTQASIKNPLFVTLDDIFEEKERCIGCIKEFSWSSEEQKRSDGFARELLDTLKEWDGDTPVYTFCQNTSSDVQLKVYRQVWDMSKDLFDNYMEKTVVRYSEDSMVLLVAGYIHIEYMKERLKKKYGCQGFKSYSDPVALNDYNLKLTLGTATLWDRTKNCFGCVG